MPRFRPSIRQWMTEYNRLAAIGSGRGLDIRPYTNLRVSNDEARARVEALAARLGEPLLIGGSRGQVPDPLTITRPSVTPRIRTLRPRGPRRSRRFGTFRPYAPAPVGPISDNSARLQLAYPAADVLQPGDLTYGIEIECCVPANTSNEEIARRLTAAGLTCQSEHYNHSLRTQWKIVSDGSVRSTWSTHRGMFELVSAPVPGYDLERQLRIATALLREIDAKVNTSCGLHVHIGIAPSIDNVSFFHTLVDLVHTNERHLDSVVAPSRRNSIFAKSIRPDTKDRIMTMRTVGEIIACQPHGDRFYKLNLQSYSRHHTVEFRQHQGTMEFEKIYNWAMICARIVVAAARNVAVAPVTMLSDFLDVIQVDATERAFFIARHARFHP